MDRVPLVVSAYLLGVLAEREGLLCVELRADGGQVLYGDPAYFGLQPDSNGIVTLADVLIGQDASVNGLLIEDLQMADGHPCDLHQVVLNPEQRFILLFDRSREHARAQRMQQSSHDAQLAHQRLESRWRRLGSEHEALARRFHELSEMQRLQEGFVRRFAHEFGTPISTVLGHVDLLHDESRPAAERLRSLQSIRRGVEYLHQLVESVLDQARLENHQFELYPGPCDLLTLCDDIRDLFAQAAAERGLRWAVTLDPAPPELVEIDALRFRQVLYNLISNAFKFTLHGSVELKLAWRDGRLRVSVSDTGAGLSSAQQAHLFDEYQRFKSGVRGTGLGLSIVHQILGHMQAKLQVQSTPGLGSRFEFEMAAPPVADRRGEIDPARVLHPVGADPGADGVATRPAELANPAPQPLALVIDDDGDLGPLLAAYLQRLGWRSDVWQDWLSAPESADTAGPQVVLIDLSLAEGRSGLVLIEKARQRWPQARIIGMSADRSQHVRDRCLRAGAQTFLGKPISEYALARVLQRQTT